MIDIVHACLIIVASVCFNGPAEVRTTRDWMFTGATLTIGDVSVTSEVGSDNIRTADESRMASKCVGYRCFLYVGGCNVSGSGATCSWSYAPSDCDELKEIRIEAPDLESIEDLMPNLYFVPFDGARVAFKELAFEPPTLPATEARARRAAVFEKCRLAPR